MSMFNKSGGGGITAAQLDLLVSDPELAAASTSIVVQFAALLSSGAAVPRGIMDTLVQVMGIEGIRNIVNSILTKVDATTTQLATAAQLSAAIAPLATATALAATKAVSDSNATKLDATVSSRATPANVSAAQTAILAAIAAGVPVASLPQSVIDTLTAALGAASGDIKMVNRTSGLASAGWTKAGGVVVPDSFFGSIRSLALPYTVGTSGLTGNNAALGYRATLGDNFYVQAYQAVNVRMFSMGTGAWTNIPNTATSSSSVYPTVFGTVNGKVLATGFQTSSATNTATNTFDPTTGSWSVRAPLPSFRCFSGVADIGNAKAALFGGKTTNTAQLVSAANILNEVQVYNESANTFTAKAVLPVRMSHVRTAVRADAKVFLLPQNTSDGTTLTTTARRVFLWDETAGTVELDQLPAECSTTPLLQVARADGTLVYVPDVTPSAGSRARLLNPAAASGSQWTQLDWDYNDQAAYYQNSVGCDCKPSSSGFVLTSVQNSGSNFGMLATYVGAPSANWSQSFYQIKN